MGVGWFLQDCPARISLKDSDINTELYIETFINYKINETWFRLKPLGYLT